MHDLDHGRAEAEAEFEQFEQWENSIDVESESLFETETAELGETRFMDEAEFLFSEAEETELALEFLEISSEAELEAFLGDFIQKATERAGQLWNSPKVKRIRSVGRAALKMAGDEALDVGKSALKTAGKEALTSFGKKALKAAGRMALPYIGKAVGGQIGGAAGANLGSKLASTAGRFFGLELEGLSAEDQEFEVARGFIRFAGNAVENMIQQTGNSDPRTVAQNAVLAAARVHAPGLLTVGRTRTVGGPSASGQSGRWLRRGSKIVLYGV